MLSLLATCQWIQSLPWASGIKHSAWQFPVIESVHSLALSFMLWPAALLDLRLLGLAQKSRSIQAVAGTWLPWVWTGFATMVATGLLLFAAEAVKCYSSPFFRVKLALIAAAGVNAAVFHVTSHRLTPLRARLAGAVSLLAWVGVVAMGRGLAYA